MHGKQNSHIIISITGISEVWTLLQSVLVKPATYIVADFRSLNASSTSSLLTASNTGDNTMIEIANKMRPIAIPHTGLYKMTELPWHYMFVCLYQIVPPTLQLLKD